jgi:putative phosphoribosyl transferase
MAQSISQLVNVPIGKINIEGMLELPENVSGLVLFAHGSGSSRHSPRNNYVAQVLRDCGIGTLLIDLLTPEEDMDYQMRFNISLLTQRLLLATNWIQSRKLVQRGLPIGYFGASTGAASALQAAANSGSFIKAVVSRGGRPDLAGAYDLKRVQCPTLLLVGGLDEIVIELNQEAYDVMQCIKELIIVPGATHLFEESGTLEKVACLAADWFAKYLNG